MKYVKANDVLPQSLLEEIHSYVEGCMIYIPQKPGNRKAWGAGSGARHALNMRNRQIRSDYGAGMDLDALADKYYLCVDTIKKILYRK